MRLLLLLLPLITAQEILAPVGDYALLSLSEREGVATIVAATVGQPGDEVKADVSKCVSVLVSGRNLCSLPNSAILGKLTQQAGSTIQFQLFNEIPTFVIYGRIVVCQVAVLPGATVAALDTSVITDVDGKFGLVLQTKEEKVTVYFSAPGKQKVYITVPLTSSTIILNDIVLFNTLASPAAAAVAFIWTSRGESDIHVITPNNRDVSYSSTSNDGATIVKDVYGFGPECVYINDVTIGNWQFWGHNFDNRDGGSNSLTYFFTRGDELTILRGPSKGTDIWWHAQDYTGATGVLTEVNTFYGDYGIALGSDRRQEPAA